MHLSSIALFFGQGGGDPRPNSRCSHVRLYAWHDKMASKYAVSYDTIDSLQPPPNGTVRFEQATSVIIGSTRLADG